MPNAILQNVAEQLMEDERLPLHCPFVPQGIVQGFDSEPSAAQIAGAELGRVRDALKAVNVAAKESSAAAPEIFAALRDAQPSERLLSPAQVTAMLNAPAPHASR